MAMEITNNYSNYTSGYASAANSRKQTAESKGKSGKDKAGFQNVKYNGFQSFLESLQNQSSLSNSWISGNISRFMKWLAV